METDRIALIRYALPDGARYAGSGLLIDEYHVLTADHVAAGLPGTYQIEFNDAKVGVAEVLRTGTPEIDLAVLTLATPVQGFARLRFARVGQGQVTEVSGCVAVGFPQWRKEGNQRRSTQVNGTVPTADGLMPTTGGGLAAGWLTLVGNRDPGAPAIPVGTLTGHEPVLQDEAPNAAVPSRWGGMSGAGVTAGDLVIGVVRSDNVAAGGHSLTVTPVTLLSKLPDERLRDRFLVALGIGELSTLPVLPEVAAPVRAIELRGLGHQPDFAGRTAELARLHRLLTGPEFGPVVVHGLGGVGKSQLAVEYWYRHRAELPVVWTLRAEDPSVLIQDLAALGVLVGAVREPVTDVPAQADATRGWLAGNSGWLLIIDGADDPAVIATVHQLLPEGGPGRVVVTSQVSVWPARYQCLELTELAAEDAAGLLPHGESDADRQAARDLADELGGLPLALRQAAGYCKQTGTPLPRYVSLFRQTGRQAQLPEVGPDGAETVDVTWRVSVAQVRETNPAAEHLLGILAYLAPAPIPRRLLAVAQEDATSVGFPQSQQLGTELLMQLFGERLPADADLAVDQALGVLRRYSLIQLSQETITVHRLVQVAVRASHDRGARDGAVICAVFLIMRMLPKPGRQAWPAYAALLPHALAVGGYGAEADSANQDYSAWLLGEFGDYQRERGLYADARRTHERVLAIAKAMVPADERRILAALSSLVTTLLAAREPGRALPLARRAMLIAHDNPEVGDAWMVEAAVGLGLALLQLGRTREALPHLEWAARIAERSFGPDHIQLLGPFAVIGETLRELGELTDGLRFTQLALGIAEREYGRDNPEIMGLVTNVAVVLTDLGRAADALPYAKRAVRIADRELGPEHPQVLRPVNNLAAVLIDLGRFTAALPLAERALRIADREFGPDHPETTLPAVNLAGVLLNLGRPGEAVPLAERAVRVIGRRYGEEHLRVAVPTAVLASALLAKGQYSAPLDLAERAVRIVDRELAPDDLRTAGPVLVLGKALVAGGRFEEAVEHLERSMRICDNALGPESVAAMQATSAMADALEKLNRPGDALPYAERTWRIFEREFGPEYAGAFEPASQLALILSELDRHTEALDYARRALWIVERDVTDRYRTAIAATQTGSALVWLGRPAEAKPHLEQAVGIFAEMRHSGSVWFQDAAGHLAKACHDLGLSADALEYAKQALQYAEQQADNAEPEVSLSITWLGGTVKQAARIACWTAEIARDAGDTRLFVAMASTASSVCESAYGPASPEAIAAVCTYTSACLQAEQPADAVDRLRDALAAAEAEHGEQSPRLVPILRYLATALTASGHPDEARPYLDRVEAAAGHPSRRRRPRSGCECGPNHPAAGQAVT